MSDALGWIAAGLTVATFSCVQPVALRVCALAANAAFIAYGASAGLWPVLVLHAALLPINVMRLLQARSRGTASCDGPKLLAAGGAAEQQLASGKK
ncbi:MAG: hypothetical protein LH479_03735 [Polaromonas sp.]|nr:hypothetical protein [Polaromonas sp.]